jgi:uncharacterized membrane protein
MSTAGKFLATIIGIIVGFYAISFLFGILVHVLYIALVVGVVAALGYGGYRLATSGRSIESGERKSLIGIPRLPRPKL